MVYIFAISKRGRPRAAKLYAKLYRILWLWLGHDVISADSKKMEVIDGNRRLRVEEIRRNPATIALAKYKSTQSRARTGLSGLPCYRSGRSEKRPSMIHEGPFVTFEIFWP